MKNEQLLSIYLHDHIAGSVGGRELVRRMHHNEQSSEFGPALKQLLDDIEFDSRQLRQISAALKVGPHAPIKERAAWIGEKLGRLKLNGHLVRRSPLSLLLELEHLQMAVNGKRALWQTLIELARTEPHLTAFDIRGLLARADDQIARVKQLHDRAVRVVFAEEPQASRSYAAE